MRWFTLAMLVVTFSAAAASSVSAQYADAVLANDPFVNFRLQEPNAMHVDAAVNSSTRATAADGIYLVHAGVNGSFADIPSIGTGNSPAKQFNRVSASQGAFVRSDQPATLGSLSEFSMSFLIRPQDYSSTDFESLYATDGFGAGAIHLNLLPKNHPANASGSSELELAVSGYGSHPRIDLESVAPLDEWSHVAVTYEVDGGQNTVNFYVNGELIDSVVRAGTQVADFNTAADIGSWQGTGRFFQGGLDEFAIFDTVLSEEQIQAQASALVPEPGSIALWTILGLLGFGLAWKNRRQK